MSHNFIRLFFCCLVVLNVLAAEREYVYEFGDPTVGNIIDQQEGIISFFSYNNEYSISVPPRMRVSFVRVTVKSVSPPKVDFFKPDTVSIKYALSQITLSKYKILAKGVYEY